MISSVEEDMAKKFDLNFAWRLGAVGGFVFIVRRLTEHEVTRTLKTKPDAI